LVRLAHERGYLSKPTINKVQHWAVGYHFYLSRRTEREDRDDFLERQCMNLNPEVWAKLYRDRLFGDALANEEGTELTAEDVDSGELDRFMEEQERQWAAEHKFQEALSGTRKMSGAKAPMDWRAMNQAEPVVWGRQV